MCHNHSFTCGLVCEFFHYLSSLGRGHYLRQGDGRGWKKGGIEFEYKQLERGGQNAQLHRGSRFEYRHLKARFQGTGLHDLEGEA